MEKIIFFGLVIPILGFVLYLGATAIMKGFSAKSANKANEISENEKIDVSSDDGNNLSDEIERLNQLLNDGILTQEEFEKAYGQACFGFEHGGHDMQPRSDDRYLPHLAAWLESIEDDDTPDPRSFALCKITRSTLLEHTVLAPRLEQLYARAREQIENQIKALGFQPKTEQQGDYRYDVWEAPEEIFGCMKKAERENFLQQARALNNRISGKDCRHRDEAVSKRSLKPFLVCCLASLATQEATSKTLDTGKCARDEQAMPKWFS